MQRNPRGFTSAQIVTAGLRAAAVDERHAAPIAGRRPLRDAVAVAAPRASRAITTAGLALAAGFGVLALVPLDQFRELAVAMVRRIVIDTFVVRSLLVPALVLLFGRAGSWPARLITREPVRVRQPDRTAVG